MELHEKKKGRVDGEVAARRGGFTGAQPLAHPAPHEALNLRNHDGMDYRLERSALPAVGKDDGPKLSPVDPTFGANHPGAEPGDHRVPLLDKGVVSEPVNVDHLKAATRQHLGDPILAGTILPRDSDYHPDIRIRPASGGLPSSRRSRR